MAWDGSGNFTRTDGTLTGPAICQTQASTGVDIQAVRFDNELNNLAEGLEKCLTVTGETLPTAPLNMNSQKVINVATATAATDATTFSQLQTYSPTGSIIMYAGSTAPASGEWLLCDGTAVSRTTYASLFATIGTTYGSGDGSTTFNVPDMRQRFPLGKAVSGTGSTLGGTGGNIDHNHTLPAHYHGMGTGADLAAVSNGAHTHTISDPAASGGAFSEFFTKYNGVNGDVGGGNNGTKYDLGSVAIQTTSNGAHTHSMTGSIGLVTGGVDGNATMGSGASNPPFLTVNYLIKV